MKATRIPGFKLTKQPDYRDKPVVHTWVAITHDAEMEEVLILQQRSTGKTKFATILLDDRTGAKSWIGGADKAALDINVAASKAIAAVGFDLDDGYSYVALDQDDLKKAIQEVAEIASGKPCKVYTFGS